MKQMDVFDRGFRFSHSIYRGTLLTVKCQQDYLKHLCGISEQLKRQIRLQQQVIDAFSIPLSLN